MGSTVRVITFTHQVDTHGEELVSVRLSFFFVMTLACDLAVHTVEFDAASYVVTWDYTKCIFGFDVLDQQCLAIL